MSTLLRMTIGGSMVLLCTTAFCRADDKSDIRESGKAFSQALVKGDPKTARKYAITDERSDQFLDRMAEMTAAREKLTSAAVAKYGEDGKSIGGMGANAAGRGAEINKDFDDAQIDVNGDTATVTSAKEQQNARAGNQPVKFKKDSGKWKIDLTQLPNMDRIEQSLPMMGKMSQAMNKTSEEIDQGKYKDVNEAKMGLRQNLMSAMGLNRRVPPGGGSGAAGQGNSGAGK